MNFWNRHLDDVGESYWQHLRFGLWAGLICFVLSVASFLHAIFPLLMPRLPERIYGYLHHRVVQPRLDRISKLRSSRS